MIVEGEQKKLLVAAGGVVQKVSKNALTKIEEKKAPK